MITRQFGKTDTQHVLGWSIYLSLAHKRLPKPTGHRFAAVVSLDPSSTSDCGIAVRTTLGLDGKTPRGKHQVPEFQYQGSVWNQRAYDDLALHLCDWVSRGEKVVFVQEDTLYGFRAVARSLGRCAGVIEGLMFHCGFYEPTDRLLVKPALYRRFLFPEFQTKWDRETCKQAAVDYCRNTYQVELEADLAEAICLNDYVINKPALWLGSKRKKALK